MSIDDNVSMFYDAKPHISEKTKMLRKNMSMAEEILWEQQDYDIGREGELESWSIEVIRFTNEEIENNIIQVIKEIEQVCKECQS